MPQGLKDRRKIAPASTYHKWYFPGCTNVVETTSRLLLHPAVRRELVSEWLKGLPGDDRKIVDEDIKDVEFA